MLPCQAMDLDALASAAAPPNAASLNAIDEEEEEETEGESGKAVEGAAEEGDAAADQPSQPTANGARVIEKVPGNAATNAVENTGHANGTYKSEKEAPGASQSTAGPSKAAPTGKLIAAESKQEGLVR
jgi:hypothetical protein